MALNRGFRGLRFQVSAAQFTTYDADDFLGAQPDALGDDGGAVPFEVLAPFGFASRPLDPEGGVGCSLVHATQGNQGFAWFGSDPRSAPLLPALAKGESMQFGAYGQFVRCHDDGSISLFTTDDGTTNGRSIYFRISPTKGFEMQCPWGRLRLGPDGFHVLHSSGARIDLGAISGIPAPLDSLASYATISAAITSLQGSATSLGTDAGATNKAAVASLIAHLTAVSASLSALGATPTVPLNPALVAQIGAVV